MVVERQKILAVRCPELSICLLNASPLGSHKERENWKLSIIMKWDARCGRGLAFDDGIVRFARRPVY